MTKFIIKVNSEATEKNDNFKGQKHQYFYGKQETEVSDFNHYSNHIGTPIPWMVKEYGFSTKASASKAMKARNELDEWETKHGFWNTHSELVEVEV